MSRYKEELIEVFENILSACKSNYAKTSALMVRNGKPMVRQALFKMVKGGSLRVVTLFEVCDKLGIDLKFESKGEVVAERKASSQDVAIE